MAIVNVDVWVTDRQGRAVTGLERDDFVVLRDGQPVEIMNFYAVEGGRARELAEENRSVSPQPGAEPAVTPGLAAGGRPAPPGGQEPFSARGPVRYRPELRRRRR